MKTIVVTGISRGLGAAIHESLKKEANDINCICLSRGWINERSECMQYIQMDFTDAEKLPPLPLISAESEIVVFINNAGTIEPIENAVDIDTRSMQVALNVNFLSPFKIAQQLTLQTKASNARLFILNVSSGAAHRPIRGWTSYCVSKAAVFMGFNVLSSENKHVSVKHFDPGVMDTGMQEYIRQQSCQKMPDVEMFKSFYANTNLKSPVDVAEDIMSFIRMEFQ